MKIELDSYIVSLIKGYEKRKQEHYSYSQVGQSVDSYSFNSYRNKIIDAVCKAVYEQDPFKPIKRQ